MQGAWEGEPREIPAGRTPLQGDREPGMARAWQALIGDGGWAGVLAESFLADPRRTVFLVFRPGMDLLPLFVEALALLPAARRWDVEFSTYFNQLPQGVSCTWRGVLDGSDEVKNAGRLPNALVLDLCRGLGHAEGGRLVHLARTGERIAPEPGATTSPPGSGRHIPRMPQEAATSALTRPDSLPRYCLGAREGIMNCFRNWRGSVPGAGLPAPAETSGPNRRQRKLHWVLVVVLISVSVIPLAFAGYFLGAEGVRRLLGSNPEIAAPCTASDRRKDDFRSSGSQGRAPA